MMSASLMAAVRKRGVATPTSILGANCLIDLQRGVGLSYSSGSLVDGWADQSGGAHDFAASFTEPTDTGGADGLDFDGSTQAISGSDFAALDVTTAWVLGIKLKPDVVTGNHVPVSRGPHTAGSWSMQSNGTAMRFHMGTPGTAFGEGGTMSAGTSTYFLIYFDGAGGSNATRLFMRKDGSAVTLSFTGTIPSSTATGSDYPELGRYSSGVQYWDGKIACFFFGNVVPSAGQITALESYLAGA